MIQKRKIDKMVMINLCLNEKVSMKMQNVWELDNLAIGTENGDHSEFDTALIKEFENNLKFTNRGYKMSLLWNTEQYELENNFDTANQRFVGLSNTLLLNEWVFEKYKGIIEEQCQANTVGKCPGK